MAGKKGMTCEKTNIRFPYHRTISLTEEHGDIIKKMAEDQSISEAAVIRQFVIKALK